MKIIFLGPPGSGKGTQAKMMAKEFGIPHISLGDILREEIKNGTEIGNKAKQFLDSGRLVPDDIVNEIAFLALRCLEKGFVLDGYPRTIYQAEFLKDVTDIDKVIYIDVQKEEIVKRLGGRRNCKNCGAVYHIVNNPPKQENKCDVCGGVLYIREDDKEETIEKRFEIYQKETNPLIEYYKGQGKLVEVDGTQAIERVSADLLAALA